MSEATDPYRVGGNDPRSTPETYQQASLFAGHEYRSFKGSLRDSGVSYGMGAASLQVWKEAIANYQHSALSASPTTQTSLFELPAHHCDPDAINPFALSFHPAEFYRLPAMDSGDACIYFVIDRLASITKTTRSPILLYIGETCRSSKRWQGVHDCKRYVTNYRELHHTHSIPTQIVMSFWWDAPSKSSQRQKLERSLITKWRSPFNKENWQTWGTPFFAL